MVCRRYLVSGRVQGVFFRASAREAARRLRLGGWVRNLPDGRVEAVACGPAADVEAFEQWLWQGPAEARVTEVQARAHALETFSGFSVR